MTFGDRLIELRKEKGFTRESFADYLGISKYTLRNYELSVNDPGSSFLKRISDIFDVSIDYLLCLTKDREKTETYPLKSSEYKHIEKYRALDLYGQETVSYILDREAERVAALQDKDKQIANLEKSLNRPSAPLRIYTYMHKIASAGKGFYFEDIPTDTIEAPYREDADFIIGVNGDSMEPTYSDGDMVYVEKCQVVNIGEIGIFVLNNECLIKEAGENGLISHNPKYALIAGSENILCVGKVLGKVFYSKNSI